jgi:predicted membrane protein
MQFNPGFRLSKVDIGIIITSLVAAGILYKYSGLFSFIVLFVVAHFFLFCNVTRMSRIPELVWAGIFVLSTSSSLIACVSSLGITIGFSVFSTIVLVALEVRKPSYHGMFWQKVNPNLEKWFESNSQASDSS